MRRPDNFNVLFEQYRTWNARTRAEPGFTTSLVDYLAECGYTIPPELAGLGPVPLLNQLAVHWGLTSPPP